MEDFSPPFIHLISVIGMLLLSGTCRSLSYDMQNYCGKELDMNTLSEYQLKLELDDDYIYDRRFYKNHDCAMTIKASRHTYDTLMFYFDHLHLNCTDGNLEFYDDSWASGYSRVVDLRTNICGSSKPQGVFTVNSGNLRIKYVSKQNQNINDILSIVITAYGNTPCSSQSYECDNSRCIDADIACNDYDSCGDGSGCDKDTKYTGIIIGGTVGGSVFLLSIFGIVVCCVCSKKKHRKNNGHVQVPTSVSTKQGSSLHLFYVNQGMAYPTGKVVYAVASKNLPSTLVSTEQNFADPARATPL